MAPSRNIILYRVFAGVAITPVMLPVIVLFWQDNGLDLFEVFLLQGIFAIAVVLLEVPTGMVADRLGKRRSLIMAMGASCIGMTVYALGRGFWSFLAAEVLLALGAALFSGADSALLYDTLKQLGREDDFAREEGRAQAIRMTGFALCNLAGGVLAEVSLRATVWASAVGPLLGLGVAWAFVEIQPRRESGADAAPSASYGTLIRDSVRFVQRHRLVQWQIAVLAVLTGSSIWLLWLYQPYMQHSGLPVWAFGIAFASFNLFAAGVSTTAQRFDRALGRVGAVAALMILHTAPLALMAWFVYPLSFLFIFGQQATRALARPIFAQRIMHYTYADKRATVLSIASLCGRLFFALTAPVVGLVAARASMGVTLWAQAIFLTAVFGVLLLAYRRIDPKYFQVKDSVRLRQWSTRSNMPPCSGPPSPPFSSSDRPSRRPDRRPPRRPWPESEADPKLLREHAFRAHVRRFQQPAVPLMRRLASDPKQPWDIQAEALGLLHQSSSPEAWDAFIEGFDALVVARGPEGAATFNALARNVPTWGREKKTLIGLIAPGAGSPGARPILAALAGRGISDYLHRLHRLDYRFDKLELRALARTEDEDTRRFLFWYVGTRRMEGMESFLVSGIVAPRPNSYRSHGGRLLEETMKGGVVGLLSLGRKDMAWKDADQTPKGWALWALGELTPRGRRLPPGLGVQLLTVARSLAPGEDRAEWGLASDIMIFLLEHDEPLQRRSEDVLASLVYQALRKNGPVEPFAAAERVSREAEIAFPRLDPGEKDRLWDTAMESLHGPFLAALARSVPNPAREKELKSELRALKDRAVKGSLRRSRCWGCEVEGPADWALAVASLGMTDLRDDVEKVLNLGWGEENAVRALVAYGEAGAPALIEFLQSRHVNRLDEGPMILAIRHCLQHIAPEAREDFVAALLKEPYTDDATRRVLREAEDHP